MPQVSRVGQGWDGLTPETTANYLDFATWEIEEFDKDYGGMIEAQVRGFAGRFVPATTSIYGCKIYTLNVEYKGNNQVELGKGDRFSISAGRATALAPIEIYDLCVDNTGSVWGIPFSLGSDYVKIDRLRVINNASNTETFKVLATLPNSHARNIVASGGTDVISIGYQYGIELVNFLMFGGTDKGFEGSANVGYTLSNSLSVTNGGNDIDVGVITVVNCATEDGTGTYTGYTLADCVDSDNDNFQIKESSSLYALNIGPFFEEASGPTVTSIELEIINLTINVENLSIVQSLKVVVPTIIETLNVLDLTLGLSPLFLNLPIIDLSVSIEPLNFSYPQRFNLDLIEIDSTVHILHLGILRDSIQYEGIYLYTY